MAKRLTDSNKYKKAFYRSLDGPYKLFWDYLYHDCNHAGIWNVDFEIAQIYIGKDMPVDQETALKVFNEDQLRVLDFNNGKSWFLPGFVDFQYNGKLNPSNRVHKSVLDELNKYKDQLINALIDYGVIFLDAPLIGPTDGPKDKDKDKDKDKVKDQVKLFKDIPLTVRTRMAAMPMNYPNNLKRKQLSDEKMLYLETKFHRNFLERTMDSLEAHSYTKYKTMQTLVVWMEKEAVKDHSVIRAASDQKKYLVQKFGEKLAPEYWKIVSKQ